MDRSKLLVVDDEEDLRTQMKWALAQDYEVLLAESRARALELMRLHRPAVITLDLGLPPAAQSVEEGFAALVDLLQEDPSVKIIVITGRAEREHALKAVAVGAYDYFSKPIDAEELKVVVRRAVHVYRLEQENREMLGRWGGDSFEGMLGTSPQMQQVFAAILKVATTDAPVLVVGESGSGKELVARAIHRQGARRGRLFVPINCGAIPENLLESELFGHEKGSFTGAHVQRRGRLEMAQGGTLFLDEIAELPLALQVKLLRFLQERTIERVGGREEITVDARVIAATNVDLRQAMAEGRFREDLYYRIAVVVIPVPPLRDRGEDVLQIARSLLQRFATETNRKVGGFTPPAIRALQTHPWPGNVRELENRLKRALIMADGPRLGPADLELATPSGKFEGKGLKEAREAVEKEMVQKALARNKGNITQTAAELGVSRPTLYELLQRLGIPRP